MKFPLPVRAFQLINRKLPYPVLTVGVVTTVAMLLLFSLTGSLYPSEPLFGYQNPLAITGQFLVFSLITAYLLACMTAQVRATDGIIESISPILPVEHHSALQRLDKVPYWPVGIIIGVGFGAAISIPWPELSLSPTEPYFLFSMMLILGQLLMWSTIGLILAAAEHNAFVLHRIGKLVTVDLYNLETLNPFGQASLRAMLIVVGSLAITPLQSIDQEFRWGNYQNPLLVGIPAILLLTLVPIWSVHKQIRAHKKNELQRLDAEINTSSRALDDSSLTRLNALLERRRLVAHCRNWPLDFSLFTRIVFYVLIPPLAWAGAALVEFGLDSYLTG